MLSSRLLTPIALSKGFLKSTYQKMKKRTKTNIVDDLIEKTAISPPTAGFPYSSLPFGKGLHSPSFCVMFDVATAENSGLTLMFKTKPISLTPGGGEHRSALSSTTGCTHLKAKRPQTTNMAAKMRSREIESSSHLRRVTLAGKSNKEIFGHQTRAQHKGLKSSAG